MNHQGHAQGLITTAGQLRPRRGGRGGQALAHNMGEIHPRLFERRAVTEHSGATASALGTLPFIDDEIGLSVLFGKAGADALLHVQKIASDACDAFIHGCADPPVFMASLISRRTYPGAAGRSWRRPAEGAG